MDALEPFHLEKEKKAFDMSYLSGFLAEKIYIRAEGFV